MANGPTSTWEAGPLRRERGSADERASTRYQIPQILTSPLDFPVELGDAEGALHGRIAEALPVALEHRLGGVRVQFQAGAPVTHPSAAEGLVGADGGVAHAAGVLPVGFPLLEDALQE